MTEWTGEGCCRAAYDSDGHAHDEPYPHPNPPTVADFARNPANAGRHPLVDRAAARQAGTWTPEQEAAFQAAMAERSRTTGVDDGPELRRRLAELESVRGAGWAERVEHRAARQHTDQEAQALRERQRDLLGRMRVKAVDAIARAADSEGRLL